MAEEEQAIEDHRQSLALFNDFEPYGCFTRIDRDDKGYLTADDIVTYLHENSIGGM